MSASEVDESVDYANAPVTEVVARLEYLDDLGLDHVQLLRLQDAWSDDYPELQVVPPLERAVDSPGPMVQWTAGVPPFRIWAAGKEDGFLLQTQSDMLALNWRATFSQEPYPRYTVMRSRVDAALTRLIAYQEARGLTPPQVVSAGYEYYNRIELGPDESPEDILNFIGSTEQLVQSAGKHTSTTYQAEFERLPTADHPMLVRTLVRCVPARSDSGRALMLSIESSVLASSASVDALVLLDYARDVARRVFDESIEDEFRRKWGRR
jgi:uncharacterized protein (TIGR04255 family)